MADKFRKRPVVVEAMHYEGKPGAVEALQDWGAAVQPTEHWFGACNESGCQKNTALLIPTLEGDMRAEDGDWIIKAVAGEFYPIKDSIFRETYERVEGDGA